MFNSWTLNFVFEEIQLKQVKTESLLIQLDVEVEIKKEVKKSKRDKFIRIKNMVSSYPIYPNVLSFLSSMSLNMVNCDSKTI